MSLFERVSLCACVFVCLCVVSVRAVHCGVLGLCLGAGGLQRDQDQRGKGGNRQTTQQLWYSPRLCAALQRAQCNADQPIRGSSVWRKVLHPEVSGENIENASSPFFFSWLRCSDEQGYVTSPLAPDTITSLSPGDVLRAARRQRSKSSRFTRFSCASRGSEQSEPETCLVDIFQRNHTAT